MLSENVNRALNNFSSVPIWIAYLSQDEVNELIDCVGDWVFCNGRIREFVFTPLTKDRIKVTTKRKEY